jgi:hypothetical protein
MSLTSMLADKSSPLRKFMDGHFPDTAAVRTAYRAAMAASDVLSPQPPDGGRPAWSTIGMAIDYRLRYALSNAPVPGGAVVHGVAAIKGGARTDPVRGALAGAGLDLLEELARLAARYEPSRRDRPLLLPAAAEEQLTRACYVAAWYEEVYRSGVVGSTTPLGTATTAVTLADLLAAVPDYAVADVMAVTSLAEVGLAPLRSTVPAARVTPGPVFDGSRAVGGADADWIAGGCLVDVKATIHPHRLDLGTIHQLIGYVLLDYSDTHRITDVGLYLARCGQLITWHLPDYLALLGATTPLARLRADLAKLLPPR